MTVGVRPAAGYFVTLTDEHLRRADAVALEESARWKGKGDNRFSNPDEGRTFEQPLEKLVLGYRGELAAAVSVGLGDFWPPASSRFDVDNFQVRTHPEARNGMILQPWRKGFHPEDPHVCVLQLTDSRYRIAGWAYGYEHSTLGVTHDFGYGPCPVIAAAMLRPMGTLPGHERYIEEPARREQAGLWP